MTMNGEFGKRLWRLGKVSLVLAILAGFVYWLRFAPVQVEQHRVDRGNIVATVMGTGTLEARVKATISPKISGRLEAVLVDQGERVTSGQVLARLDSQDLEQQVAIAEAGVAAAHAAVELVDADLVRAKAIIDQAKRDYDRFSHLTSAQVATSVEFEKASESLAVAEAGYNRARAATLEARKRVISADKTLQYQRARLADTILPAPFDGLIVKRQRDPGDVVIPGGAVLSLISTDEMWISAWVDETRMSQLAEGQQAKIAFRSDPGKSYKGMVARLGREADRETREFVVDVRADELPLNWAVGQRAEVYIETGEKKECVVLPPDLVVWKEGRPGVFAANSSKARWRPLKLGIAGEDFVEVLEGLSPGDVVIHPVTKTGAPLVEGRRVVSP